MNDEHQNRPVTILPIVKFDIPTLTQISKEWDFDNPPMDAATLAYNLVDTMLHNNGIGLAAIQVGIPYRVFAMRGATNEAGNPEMFCFFNPKLVSVSDEQIKLEEGCLSFPNVVIEIKRPKDVRLRFALPNGQVDTRTFTGMTARCVQHEIDHLDGKIFYNLANLYRRNKALKDAVKYQKQYVSSLRQNP